MLLSFNLSNLCRTIPPAHILLSVQFCTCFIVFYREMLSCVLIKASCIGFFGICLFVVCRLGNFSQIKFANSKHSDSCKSVVYKNREKWIRNNCRGF